MSHIRAVASHSLLAVLEAGIIALIVLTLVVAPALAAKGGAGKGPGKPGGGGGGSTSFLVLVMVDPTDTTANHGDTISFAVSTTATDRPFVSVNCYQGATWVYSASVGYFADYPWSQSFVLASTSWPGGAASCTARLYASRDGTKTTTLATLDFAVDD